MIVSSRRAFLRLLAAAGAALTLERRPAAAALSGADVANAPFRIVNGWVLTDRDIAEIARRGP